MNHAAMNKSSVFGTGVQCPCGFVARLNVSRVDEIQEDFAGVVLLAGICLCSPLLHRRFRRVQCTPILSQYCLLFSWLVLHLLKTFNASIYRDHSCVLEEMGF